MSLKESRLTVQVILPNKFLQLFIFDLIAANSNGQLTADDILVLQMDMLDMNSHKKNFDYAVRYFGAVDILLNNAGRSQRANWEDIDMTVDKQMFDLNVFSVVNLTRIAVKYFKERGYGHVAVTSSLAGVIGAPLSGTYTATKHAIHVSSYCNVTTFYMVLAFSSYRPS